MNLSYVNPDWSTPEKLLSLVIWREARGESYQAQLAVGCSVRNRVRLGGWWGSTYQEVILLEWQYSSFNADDPNSTKYPDENSQSYKQCLEAAQDVLNGCDDASQGADSYYDDSIPPPHWAAPPAQLTVKIGRLNFWKTRV